MSIIIPQAVNYPDTGQLIQKNLAFALRPEPPEGPRLIQAAINWGTMGGAAKCVVFNMQAAANASFSQIVAIKVDNSDCGSDVEFIWTDTQEVLTIPAYSPAVICPVFTNTVQFYVHAKGPVVLDEDATRFMVFNVMPPPVAVPTSQEQQIASGNTLGFDGVGTDTIISAAESGTLESMKILLTSLGATADCHYLGQIVDGSVPPRVLGNYQVDLASGQAFTGFILDLGPCSLRFKSGVFLVQTLTVGAGNQGFLSPNFLYRDT